MAWSQSDAKTPTHLPRQRSAILHFYLLDLQIYINQVRNIAHSPYLIPILVRYFNMKPILYGIHYG